MIINVTSFAQYPDSLMLQYTTDSIITSFIKTEFTDSYKELNKSDIYKSFYIYNKRALCKAFENDSVRYIDIYRSMTLGENLNKFKNLNAIWIKTGRKLRFKDDIELENISFFSMYNYHYFKTLPLFLKQQNKLVYLNTGIDNLESFFDEVKAIQSLECLILRTKDAQEIPNNIVNLINLEYFSLGFDKSNELITVPEFLIQMSNIQTLYLPIDLGDNLSVLEKMPKLISLSVETVNPDDYEKISDIMDNILYLIISRCDWREILILKKMYPNVQINEYKPISYKDIEKKLEERSERNKI